MASIYVRMPRSSTTSACVFPDSEGGGCSSQAQVLVDGPSEKAPVPRHAAALSTLSLVPIVISKLPRATGRAFVKKRWEEEKVTEQFDSSAWAKKREAFAKRRQLNDFERFKVMKLRKQVRWRSPAICTGVRPNRAWQRAGTSKHHGTVH